MVTITNRTRISEIIKANPHSIDVITAIAKPLQKLKNPLLRKIMAPRVTLEEAASIGGCDPGDIIGALIPLGFKHIPFNTENDMNEEEKKPKWLLSVPQDMITELDVRPVIEHGQDPLKQIIEKFGALRDGQILCIINSFVPYPLINLLSKQSLTYTEQSEEASTHYTWFLKRQRHEEVQETSVEGIHMEDEDSFGRVLSNFDEKQLVRIDVRSLPMPEPMQVILQELKSLPSGHALYVYHKRVPVYLLEEIRHETFTIHILDLGVGEVRLLIYK